MTRQFEELGYARTALGEISLRRRAEPRLGGQVIYEVKLGEEFLMSSLFTDAEIQLARLGLAALEGPALDIVVGGLGLGYTAAAALDDPRVRSVRIIELLEPVIDWHRRRLLPVSERLLVDPRCMLDHADFFALAAREQDGFDPADPARRVHAVLLDIDHSPTSTLAPANSAFYTGAGLRELAGKIHPGGVFGLWSNDPPDATFLARLHVAFPYADAHIISFSNPYTGGTSSNTVYLAHR